MNHLFLRAPAYLFLIGCNIVACSLQVPSESDVFGKSSLGGRASATFTSTNSGGLSTSTAGTSTTSGGTTSVGTVGGSSTGGNGGTSANASGGTAGGPPAGGRGGESSTFGGSVAAGGLVATGGNGGTSASPGGASSGGGGGGALGGAAGGGGLNVTGGAPTATGGSAITKAADEFLEAGFVLPDDQEVFLQLLEHNSEARVLDAVQTLHRILAGELPKRKPVLEQRLRRIEDHAETGQLSEAASALRRLIGGRAGGGPSSAGAR